MLIILKKVKYKVDEYKSIALSTGVANVFASSALNKGLSFVSSVIITRVLSKREYGVFSYSNNILQMLMLFTGLGVREAMYRVCSENIEEKEKNEYFHFCFSYGIKVDFIFVIVGWLMAAVYPFEIDGAGEIFLFLLPILLLDYIKEYIGYILRCKIRNKEFAIKTNVDSVCSIIGACIGAYLFGVYGYIGGLYFGYFASLFLGYLFIKPYTKDILNAKKLKVENKRRIRSFGIILCMTMAVSQSLYLIDTYLVGHIIRDSDILADYKIASAIPFAFNFIPSSFMLVVMPRYAYRKMDSLWIRSMTRKVIGINGAVNLSIGLIMLVFSDFFITTIYGKQYENAVPCFKILVVAFIVSSCIRIPLGNILSMYEEMAKRNLMISIITGMVNIILDVVLIYNFGAIGAAYATFLMMLFSSMISVILYAKYLKLITV